MKLLSLVLWTLGAIILFTILILGVRMATAVVFDPISGILPRGTSTPLFWAIQGAIIAVPAVDFFKKRRWNMFVAILIAFVISLSMGTW